MIGVVLDKVVVEMTAEEAVTFKLLYDAGVFSGVDFGKITINYGNGKIQNIVKECRLYTRLS